MNNIIAKGNELTLERKLCTRCLIEKSVDEFYFRKKDRRYESFCKECTKEYKKQYYNKNKNEIAKKQKQYYLENRDKKLEYIKEYVNQNESKVKQYRKEHYKNNKSEISNKHKEYYEKHKEKIKQKTKEYFKNNKEKIYSVRNERTKNDELYAYKTKTRKLISRAFYDKNFNKYKELEKIVGCSYNMFLFHLYYTFNNNYNIQYYDYKGKTNIDHKIPLNEAKTIEDVKLLNHYTNLQLLKEEDNRKKGVKLDYEI